MGTGCGAHGHHAQQYVEQELGLEQHILALDQSMLGCHALVVDQRLKAVKVSSVITFIHYYLKLDKAFSFFVICS